MGNAQNYCGLDTSLLHFFTLVIITPNNESPSKTSIQIFAIPKFSNDVLIARPNELAASVDPPNAVSATVH